MAKDGSRAPLAFALCAALLACGGRHPRTPDENPRPLTCAFLAGDNCVKQVALAAVPCLPSYTEWGQLSADWSRCVYPGGIAVDLQPPLASPEVPPASTNFVETGADGTRCLEIHSTLGDWSETSSAGTVTAHVDGTSVILTCPDGTRYQGPSETLAACGDAVLPSTEFEAFTDGAKVQLHYVSNPIIAFQCTQEPQ